MSLMRLNLGTPSKDVRDMVLSWGFTVPDYKELRMDTVRYGKIISFYTKENRAVYLDNVGNYRYCDTQRFIPDYKELRMSSVKTIKFVEKSMKDYTCSVCTLTMPEGSSYFSFERLNNKYDRPALIDREKVCFDCYPKKHKEFRKDRDIRSLKATVRNISNTVDSLSTTLESVNNQLGEVNDKLANMGD